MVFVPPKGQCLCIGFSRFQQAGNSYYRFHLEDEDKIEFTLSVGLYKGQTAELILYRQCDGGEVFPENSEEWGVWLDEENGLIGNQYFTINGLEYDRVTNPEVGHRLEPLEYVEMVFLDEFRESGDSVKNIGMAYGRTINVDGDIEIKEFALPESRRDHEGAYVNVMVGVEIDEIGVTVL